LAAKDEVAEASALLLHAVEKAASPNEINGQQAETKNNGEPAGTGTDEENDAESQKREPGDNAEDAERLAERFEDK
jgi:hypothetical protein